MLQQNRFELCFQVSDPTAFCRQLQQVVTPHDRNPSFFRHRFGRRQFSLNPQRYNPGLGLATFDLVDATGLMPFITPLEIVLETTPLLKDAPWATLINSIYIDKINFSDSPYPGDVPPDLLESVLGITPLEVRTGVQAECHRSETVTWTNSSGFDILYPEASIRQLIIWKKTEQVSGQAAARAIGQTPTSLSIDRQALGNSLTRTWVALHEVCIKRESSLGIFDSCQNANPFVTVFAHLLRQICCRYRDVCDHAIGVLFQFLGRQERYSKYVEELSTQMILWNVNGVQKTMMKPRVEASSLYAYEVPGLVAVTVSIGSLHEAYSLMLNLSGQQLFRISNVRAVLKNKQEDGTDSFHCFEDVHLVSLSHAESESNVCLHENLCRGFPEKDPIYSSFWAPSSLLTESTSVALSINFTTGLGGVVEHKAFLFNRGAGEGSWGWSLNMPPYGQKDMFFARDFGSQKFLEGPDVSHSGRSKTVTLLDHWDSESRTQRLGPLESSIILGPDFEPHELLTERVDVFQPNPFAMQVSLEDVGFSRNVHFPLPATADPSKIQVTQSTGRIGILADVAVARPWQHQSILDFIFPTALTIENLPVSLNMPIINLDKLPITSVRNDDIRLTIMDLYTNREFPELEKRARGEHVIHSSRVLFKLAISWVFSMVTQGNASRYDGSGLIALKGPDENTAAQILMYVSAIRIDADAGALVLDAAIITMTKKVSRANKVKKALRAFEWNDRNTISFGVIDFCLLKENLPAMVERCRTWAHKPSCEYLQGKCPLSMKAYDQFLCSCGNGKFPLNYDKVARSAVAPLLVHGVRVAISRAYPVALTESLSYA